MTRNERPQATAMMPFCGTVRDAQATFIFVSGGLACTCDRKVPPT
jgi:hypothetical protein